MSGKEVRTKPKILFIDLETAPILAYVWRIGPKYNLTTENIKSDQKLDIICACWKWEGDPKIYSLRWNRSHSSKQMVIALKREIEKADLVVAHAGDRFDVKHLNAQCLVHRIEPISWPQTFDTLTQCRKAFYLASFKLDYLSKLLVRDQKHRMQFEDWIDIVERRSPEALDKMVKYCGQDVRLLSQVYHKIKPYLTPKANLGLVNHERYSCPICGSNQSKSAGIRYTMATTYQRRRCTACGHVFRGRTVKI